MEGDGQVHSGTRRAMDRGRRGACLGSISWGLWRVGRTMGNSNGKQGLKSHNLVGRSTHFLSVV